MQGDLVLQKVVQNTQDRSAGVLGPNWEGPYVIAAQIHDATYKLEELDGTPIKHPWNAAQFKTNNLSEVNYLKKKKNALSF